MCLSETTVYVYFMSVIDHSEGNKQALEVTVRVICECEMLDEGIMSVIEANGGHL